MSIIRKGKLGTGPGANFRIKHKRHTPKVGDVIYVQDASACEGNRHLIPHVWKRVEVVKVGVDGCLFMSYC